MRPLRKTPSHPLERREGESKATFPTISPLPAAFKPFDAVERRLSLTLDALLDAIDTYRGAKR